MFHNKNLIHIRLLLIKHLCLCVHTKPTCTHIFYISLRSTYPQSMQSVTFELNLHLTVKLPGRQGNKGRESSHSGSRGRQRSMHSLDGRFQASQGHIDIVRPCVVCFALAGFCWQWGIFGLFKKKNQGRKENKRNYHLVGKIKHLSPSSTYSIIWSDLHFLFRDYLGHGNEALASGH